MVAQLLYVVYDNNLITQEKNRNSLAHSESVTEVKQTKNSPL